VAPNKAIQEAPQHNEQGRHALRTVVPWQETVVKLNDRDTMSTGTSALLSGMCSQTREGFADCYVPSGRIGKLNLNSGCYTTYEIWQLAARDIAARALEGEVRALLSAGRHSVRDSLNQAYGCLLGRREYFTVGK